jgi:endoglucanase
MGFGRTGLVVAGACLLFSAMAFADVAPPQLRVVGNHLENEQGQTVWLQGINVPSLEWSSFGEHVLESIPVAIDQWHANIIRLPMSEDCWFGKIAAEQHDGGEAYRKLVDSAVAACSGRKAYIILDLHWTDGGVWGHNLRQTKLPDMHALEFWKDVATRYANNPAVFFDIFNEPFDISWQVWRDGGTIEMKTFENQMVKFQTPGMQAMLNTIRKTGAKNICLAGGLGYAYDLRGVLNGYALEDKDSNGLMYSTHIYVPQKNWAENVDPIAKKYAVFLGEVGCEMPTKDTPDWGRADPYVWGPNILGYIQKNHINWTAWCMHPAATPCLIQNWTYLPTPAWGAFVRAALDGVHFELVKEH